MLCLELFRGIHLDINCILILFLALLAFLVDVAFERNRVLGRFLVGHVILLIQLVLPEAVAFHPMDFLSYLFDLHLASGMKRLLWGLLALPKVEDLIHEFAISVVRHFFLEALSLCVVRKFALHDGVFLLWICLHLS